MTLASPSLDQDKRLHGVNDPLEFRPFVGEGRRSSGDGLKRRLLDGAILVGAELGTKAGQAKQELRVGLHTVLLEKPQACCDGLIGVVGLREPSEQEEPSLALAGRTGQQPAATGLRRFAIPG